jgi:D-glycero-D-manno-heptose 1,7-bisphosphate phosphatase
MATLRSGRPAAFIDRDGVINVDREYVFRPADFEFLPGAVEALRALRAAGYLLVVITNQSGIARGIYSEAEYRELEAFISAQLAAVGVALDAVEYCPHLADAPVVAYRRDCECRKPRPGMLLRAAAHLGIDLQRSVLIGDRSADISAGRAAGVGRCLLVRSGKPLLSGDSVGADAVYDDLAACARALLKGKGMAAEV